ncbi:MAG: hypothetical protein Aureis2KO_14800 [Aureisphaera sp.]
MNFFKKLFSSKKEDTKNKGGQRAQVNEIATKEYFDQRYTEEQMDKTLLDGSSKMIESYFVDNKMERKVQEPINHPTNLDQAVEDGMGFQMYCKAFQMEDSMVVATLSTAFSEFMIQNFGFKMYKDHTPEFPLRSMTLKYDKNGAVLSLYPYEYSLKVLNYEATFEDIYMKIKGHLENMPNVEDVLKNLKTK